MKLNNIDIKTRLLAKLPSVYGYHKLINSKSHSYTNPNHSSTNPYTNLKTKNLNPRYPHSHNYYLISFLFKEKENDGDDMAWIS